MSGKYESIVSRVPESASAMPALQAFDRNGGAFGADAVSAHTSAIVRALPVTHRDEVQSQAKIGKALVSLRNGRRSERINAARELGDIAISFGVNVPEAVVPLSVTLSGDRDPVVRQEAAWSLWKLGDERGYTPLLRAFRSTACPAANTIAARRLPALGIRPDSLHSDNLGCACASLHFSCQIFSFGA